MFKEKFTFARNYISLLSFALMCYTKIIDFFDNNQQRILTHLTRLNTFITQNDIYLIKMCQLYYASSNFPTPYDYSSVL